MQHLTRLALNLAEQGLFPDVAIRWGIRQLLKQRLREIRSDDARTAARQEMRFIEEMRVPHRSGTGESNDQHYESVGSSGGSRPHLKYSSEFWPPTRRWTKRSRRFA
jgi:cyclopropane-fatty-acyl-phospholipid synthase